jgi:3D (Asp-Asp-Asp) domain-containing protein
MNNKNIFILIPAIAIFLILSLTLVIDSKNLEEKDLSEENYIFENNDLPLFSKKEEAQSKAIKVILTAYSSTVDQTDEDPFTTASGIHVKNGIVANNMLPFGTEIKIPEYFGERVFIVEDRMHSRKGPYWVDIWFESREAAKEFGIKEAYMEIKEI